MSAIGIDYRTSSGQLAFQDIEQKKIILSKCITEEHPEQKIEYNLVKNRESHFYADFQDIYNRSCAYCGTRVGIMDSQLFEIDHFICKAAYPKTSPGQIEAGKLNNLVFACRNCNRGKRDFNLKNNYGKLLNPDNNAIAKVFYRSEDYYIKIVDAYKNNQIVCQFYNQLNLGSELKRLDYLLLNMKELADSQANAYPDFSQKLKKLFSDLLQKRNALSYNLSSTH